MIDRAVSVGGMVAPGFEPARNAFADNFTERGELGGAVCVVVAGEVVGLWGGMRDEASGTIRRAVEAADRDAIQELVRRHLLINGVGLAEARVLYRIMRGTVPSSELSNADTVALGTLVNAGLVQLEKPESKDRAPAWVSADEVARSLRLSS